MKDQRDFEEELNALGESSLFNQTNRPEQHENLERRILACDDTNLFSGMIEDNDSQLQSNSFIGSGAFLHQNGPRSSGEFFRFGKGAASQSTEKGKSPKRQMHESVRPSDLDASNTNTYVDNYNQSRINHGENNNQSHFGEQSQFNSKMQHKSKGVFQRPQNLCIDP